MIGDWRIPSGMEPKFYFYDTGLVLGDEGIRLENLVAVSLLKHLNWVEDSKGIRCSLQTLRTKEKKEVDFVMVVEDEFPQDCHKLRLRAEECISS